MRKNYPDGHLKIKHASHNKIVVCITFLVLSLLFGGCGKKAQKEQLAKAEALVESENYEEALEQFKELKKADVDLRRVYRGMGIAYMGMEQYEDAISAFEKSLKEAGGKISDWEYDTNYYLAIAFEKSGNRQEAIDTWSNLLAVKKESESYFQRGLLYLKDKKEDKAEKDFDAAIAVDGENAALPIRIWESVGADYPELGAKYLQELVKREAKSGEALYYKGLAYLKLGETTAAEDTLKQAVKKGYSEANLTLGEMFNVEESYDYAIGFYQAYLKDNPDSEKAYEELMAAQMVQKDYTGALATFDAAKEKKNMNGENLDWYEIVCYEYMGDYATAREKAAAYVEAWPRNEKAVKEYEFLQTR